MDDYEDSRLIVFTSNLCRKFLSNARFALTDTTRLVSQSVLSNKRFCTQENTMEYEGPQKDIKMKIGMFFELALTYLKEI